MSLKNRLIGAGIVLSAVGYIAYLAANQVVNNVKDEARKLEEEKAAELEKAGQDAAEEAEETAAEETSAEESAAEETAQAVEEATESDFVDEDTPAPDPA